jgi:hypothetical protein
MAKDVETSRGYFHFEQESNHVLEYNWALLLLGGNKYTNLALQVGGVLRIERVKYGNESRGIQTRERLRWRGPAMTENYRPDLSLEIAPDINKPVTV